MIFKNAHIIENLEINYNLNVNLIEAAITENKGRLSIITILSGMVLITNCQLTLAYLSTSTNYMVPAIYVENSVIFMESTYVKGNREFLTIGMLAYNANIKTVNCVFSNHRAGGILSHVVESNKININKTKFTENTGCGIFVKGFGEILLQDNLIEKNHGNGIYIIDSKSITTIGNKINENLLNGAQLINCDGLIMLNSFFKNKSNGLLIESQEERPVLIKIMKNTICENYQNGIVLMGNNNTAQIFQNDRISYNNLAGIHISHKAHPTIKENKIFENMNQGILIVSGASSIIESNEIFQNIKANIAFGGELVEKTKIMDNKIYGSRNEGIFIIKGKGGIITRNEIYENNDGVIVVSCESPEISYNNIYKNLRTGILLSDKSKVKVIGNQIHNNQFLGLFMRQQSEGEILNNDINHNISQLYLSKDCKHQLNYLQKRNSIDGRIDIASTCNIL